MTTDWLNSRWLDLDGPTNARDLGGLPLAGSGRVRPGVLLRSDHLQDLTERDLATLRGFGISDVIDLRTDVERDLEGPAPLDAEPGLTLHRMSFLPKADDAGTEIDGKRVIPWQEERDLPEGQVHRTLVYSSYLQDRPDSVVHALKAMAHAPGSVLVHCAAGKDRTGTFCALALDLVGADREAVLADYALTGERIPRIIARMLGSETYRANLEGRPLEVFMPRPQAITDVFEVLDAAGGAEAWLMSRAVEDAWTEADTAALRARLVDDASGAGAPGGRA